MKIIFDLDGTLICSKKRLHQLFCELINSREIDFESYWSYKFSGSSNQDILRNQFNYSTAQIEVFLQDWMRKIESSYYLNMDKTIPGSIEILEKLSKNNELYICTARQSAAQTHKQLRKLSLFNFFQGIFITEQKLSKEELLNESNILFTNKDWFVGDTGHDIIAGKKVGTQTCAVLSGFMSENSLRAYSPDLIIKNITLLSV